MSLEDVGSSIRNTIDVIFAEYGRQEDRIRELAQDAIDRKSTVFAAQGSLARIETLEAQLQEQIARGDILQNRVSTALERLATAKSERHRHFEPLEVIDHYAAALGAVEKALRAGL